MHCVRVRSFAAFALGPPFSDNGDMLSQTKRWQVTLTELWAKRLGNEATVVSMHPGPHPCRAARRCTHRVWPQQL
jgi:hypothetical protein